MGEMSPLIQLIIPSELLDFELSTIFFQRRAKQKSNKGHKIYSAIIILLHGNLVTFVTGSIDWRYGRRFKAITNVFLLIENSISMQQTWFLVCRQVFTSVLRQHIYFAFILATLADVYSSDGFNTVSHSVLLCPNSIPALMWKSMTIYPTFHVSWVEFDSNAIHYSVINF